MLTTVHPYGAHSLCVCLCACVFCLCVSVCFPVCLSWLLVSNLQLNDSVKAHTTSVWSNWTDSFWSRKHDFKNLDYCCLFLFFSNHFNQKLKIVMGWFLWFSLVGTGYCWASRCISTYWQKWLTCELFSLDGYKVTMSCHVNVSFST